MLLKWFYLIVLFILCIGCLTKNFNRLVVCMDTVALQSCWSVATHTGLSNAPQVIRVNKIGKGVVYGNVTTERATERKPHPSSGVSSDVSVRGVQFHGLLTEPPSRESTVTPVGEIDCGEDMATVISVGRVRDEFEPSNNDKTNGKDRHPRKALLEETAGGAMEMATVLNEPGMKRSESSEILHLTLHQVSDPSASGNE